MSCYVRFGRVISGNVSLEQLGQVRPC